MSSAPPRGTFAMISRVPGASTPINWPLAALTHSPSMNMGCVRMACAAAAVLVDAMLFSSLLELGDCSLTPEPMDHRVWSQTAGTAAGGLGR
jgi:hypothetical protein